MTPLIEDPSVKTIQRNGAVMLIGILVVVPVLVIVLWLTGQL